MQRKNPTRKTAANPGRDSKPGLPGALLDASAAAIHVKDKEGRYLLANREAERALHTGGDQILGRTDYDLLPKEIADLFHSHDQEVLATGTPLAREEVLPMEDGPHTAVSVKFPICDASGVCYAVGGISTDITEQKLLLTPFLPEEVLRTSHLAWLSWSRAQEGRKAPLKAAPSANVVDGSSD